MSGRRREGERERPRDRARQPTRAEGTTASIRPAGAPAAPAASAGEWKLRADDASVAVMAHALLGSMAVISGAAETLDGSWSDLSEANRRALLAMINGQSAHVSGLLRDLIRGLPEGPIRGLELLGGRDGLAE